LIHFVRTLSFCITYKIPSGKNEFLQPAHPGRQTSRITDKKIFRKKLENLKLISLDDHNSQPNRYTIFEGNAKTFCLRLQKMIRIIASQFQFVGRVFTNSLVIRGTFLQSQKILKEKKSVVQGCVFR